VRDGSGNPFGDFAKSPKDCNGQPDPRCGENVARDTHK